MSRTNELELQLQQLLFSVNPVTSLPYPANNLEVADGQGTRVWKDVFQTISSQSVMDGNPIGYLPTTVLQLYGTTSTLSTTVTGNYNSLSSQIAAGGIPGSITSLQLQSTVNWVQKGSYYISTADLTSTMTPFFNGSLSYMSNIQSTVIGLGSAQYISSPTLLSTSLGFNNENRSTVRGLGSYGYISSLSLQSTVANLGLASYISSSALTSTVTGLLYPATSFGGNLGVVVTGTSAPPFLNFNSLLSAYLTTNNYFSQTNAAGYGIVYGASLPSTTTGLISSLGTYGYVSSLTLLSTSEGILNAKQNVYIDRSGATNIYGSQVFISSVAAITFLSSFVNSTITYRGQNGAQVGVITNNSNLTISSASLQLDAFSSLITSASRITVDVYPTFQFDSLTTGALASKAIPMSTFIQYSTIYLSTFHQSQVAGITAQAGYSNFYQQPIKISIPGTQVLGAYANPYVLSHVLPGGVSYQTNVGFKTGNVNTFFASTNSYFLTIQNLSF